MFSHFFSDISLFCTNFSIHTVTWTDFLKSTFPTAAAKLRQSCPTLCDPIDGSPPGSPIPGILQARTLEWVAISFSKAWKWKVKVKLLSHVRPSATPWTAAFQAAPAMGFSRQEYWSWMPLPSPLDKVPKCLNSFLMWIYYVDQWEKNTNYKISGIVLDKWEKVNTW